MEQQLKKLLTDDPSVVETTLEKCAEAAHAEKTGVIRRFVFLNSREIKHSCLLSLLCSCFFFFRIELLEKCFCHDTVEEIIDSLVSLFANDSANVESLEVMVFGVSPGSRGW